MRRSMLRRSTEAHLQSSSPRRRKGLGWENGPKAGCRHTRRRNSTVRPCSTSVIAFVCHYGTNKLRRLPSTSRPRKRHSWSIFTNGGALLEATFQVGRQKPAVLRLLALENLPNGLSSRKTARY